MKFCRAGLLLLIFSAYSFAASKEMVALQQTVNDIQQRVDAMERDLDTKLGELTATMQQVQDSANKSNAQLQDSLNNGIGRQLQPVATLGTRVDSVGDDVRSLKDTINDLNARLERMDAKITDLKNQMQIMQSPPAVPGAGVPGSTVPGAGTGAPGQGQTSGPPPGMSLDKTYTDARRDLQTGNADLASQEFHQILTYYPDSELAANAQYYVGEIAYNKGDYSGAVQSFDAVLERYPNNPKTADAHWMKGMSLVKAGQRNRAVQEFRALIEQFPRTDDARKAQAQLHQLGVTTTTTARRR
jgi:tol-pal system protein YbgF